jgi:hypothetical protein
LVDREELPNAIALFNATNTSVRIIGPAILGILLSLPFIGLTYVFYFVTLSYTIPVIQLLRIRKPPRPIARRDTNVLGDFWEGVRYMVGHPVLRLLLFAAFVPAIFGNLYQQILPVVASDEWLDAGKSGFGLLATAAGIGALTGSLIVASMKTSSRAGLYQVLAGAGLGLGLIWFGLMDALIPALVALIAVGFTSSVFQTLNTSQAIAVSEEAFYGRVGSTQQMSWSVVSVAYPAIGYAVDAFGAPVIIVLSGVFVLVFWVLIGFLVPAYRNRERVLAAQQAVEA